MANPQSDTVRMKRGVAQQIVGDVAQRHSESDPAEIVEMLREGLTSRALPTPPPDWLGQVTMQVIAGEIPLLAKSWLTDASPRDQIYADPQGSASLEVATSEVPSGAEHHHRDNPPRGRATAGGSWLSPVRLWPA